MKDRAGCGHYLDVLPAPITPRAEVLVVDPDAGVRDVCASMLHSLGYRALTRSTADDLALSASRARSVDVVIVDVEARFESASLWVRELKRGRPSLRVLVMSGRPNRDLSPFLEDGADGLLHKPFRLAELDAHIAAVARGAAH